MFDSFIKNMGDKIIQRQSIRFFTVLVYGWFIWNAIMLWPVKDMLWGPDKIFYRHGFPDGMLSNFFYMLVYQSTRAPYIFYLHILAAAVSMGEFRLSFIPRLITWATGWMLFYSATEAFNSGMMIMLMMAFFCAFIYTHARKFYGVALSNFMRIACITQVMIVYAAAGLYKLTGSQWLAGEAFYYAMQIDQYSSPFWQSANVIAIPGLFLTMNYVGLGYQLLFPVVIWIKKIRPFFLILGFSFHLFIGIFMHLWDFAFAMIFCYALFLEDKNIASLKRYFIRYKLTS